MCVYCMGLNKETITTCIPTTDDTDKTVYPIISNLMLQYMSYIIYNLHAVVCSCYIKCYVQQVLQIFGYLVGFMKGHSIMDKHYMYIEGENEHY